MGVVFFVVLVVLIVTGVKQSQPKLDKRKFLSKYVSIFGS